MELIVQLVIEREEEILQKPDDEMDDFLMHDVFS
jgi:hypothetical protein